jgi:hypothetical protein
MSKHVARSSIIFLLFLLVYGCSGAPDSPQDNARWECINGISYANINGVLAEVQPRRKCLMPGDEIKPKWTDEYTAVAMMVSIVPIGLILYSIACIVSYNFFPATAGRIVRCGKSWKESKEIKFKNGQGS